MSSLLQAYVAECFRYGVQPHDSIVKGLTSEAIDVDLGGVHLATVRLFAAVLCQAAHAAAPRTRGAVVAADDTHARHEVARTGGLTRLRVRCDNLGSSRGAAAATTTTATASPPLAPTASLYASGGGGGSGGTTEEKMTASWPTMRRAMPSSVRATKVAAAAAATTRSMYVPRARDATVGRADDCATTTALLRTAQRGVLDAVVRTLVAHRHTLRVVQLSGIPLVHLPEYAARLMRVLPRCTRLHTLALCGCAMTAEQLTWLTRSCRDGFAALRRLTLTQCSLTDACARAVYALLTMHSARCEADAWRRSLREARAVATTPTTTTTTPAAPPSPAAATITAITCPATAATAPPQSTVLHTTPVVRARAQEQQQQQTLRQQQQRQQRPGAQDRHRVATSLRTPRQSSPLASLSSPALPSCGVGVAHVDLSDNALGDATLSALARALASGAPVRSVDLTRNRITAAALLRLVRSGVLTACALQSLDVSRNLDAHSRSDCYQTDDDDNDDDTVTRAMAAAVRQHTPFVCVCASPQQLLLIRRRGNHDDDNDDRNGHDDDDNVVADDTATPTAAGVAAASHERCASVHAAATTTTTARAASAPCASTTVTIADAADAVTAATAALCGRTTASPAPVDYSTTNNSNNNNNNDNNKSNNDVAHTRMVTSAPATVTAAAATTAPMLLCMPTTWLPLCALPSSSGTPHGDTTTTATSNIGAAAAPSPPVTLVDLLALFARACGHADGSSSNNKDSDTKNGQHDRVGAAATTTTAATSTHNTDDTVKHHNDDDDGGDNGDDDADVSTATARPSAALCVDEHTSAQHDNDDDDAQARRRHDEALYAMLVSRLEASEAALVERVERHLQLVRTQVHALRGELTTRLERDAAAQQRAAAAAAARHDAALATLREEAAQRLRAAPELDMMSQLGDLITRGIARIHDHVSDTTATGVAATTSAGVAAAADVTRGAAGAASRDAFLRAAHARLQALSW